MSTLRAHIHAGKTPAYATGARQTRWSTPQCTTHRVQAGPSSSLRQLCTASASFSTRPSASP